MAALLLGALLRAVTSRKHCFADAQGVWTSRTKYFTHFNSSGKCCRALFSERQSCWKTKKCACVMAMLLEEAKNAKHLADIVVGTIQNIVNATREMLSRNCLGIKEANRPRCGGCVGEGAPPHANAGGSGLGGIQAPLAQNKRIITNSQQNAVARIRSWLSCTRTVNYLWGSAKKPSGLLFSSNSAD